MPKIVVLDGHVANPGDLSWEDITNLGEVEIYDRTPANQVYERAKDADILVVNKVVLDEVILNRLSGKLKCICTLATGYNNVDVKTANRWGITVCNAVGYSSSSVAQHVFALLLELTNQVALNNQSVQNNEWANSMDWSYRKSPMMQLAGKTMGIYGPGQIGRKVIEIARAFGMKIIATRKNPHAEKPYYVKIVDLPTLFGKSDVLTLHAPLTYENREVVNRRTLSLMKPTAFLINTGRGGLVNESDLREALLQGWIAGAGLDVLSEEPPPKDHPLLKIPNCIITPHQAWGTKESRANLLYIVAQNIAAFLEGKPQNVVEVD
ncbi:MAG: D-2-hydroxyacid dehydrogenase [Chitinophagales bacterium]